MTDFKELTAQQRLQQEKTKAQIPSMIRVNQAGEFGAVQIYRGQMLALRKESDSGKIISQMLEHEQRHLDLFNNLMTKRRIRPTILAPLWRVAGFGLGAISGMISAQAAMACTVAVEDAIDEHYAKQAEMLKDVDEELLQVVNECHAEELHHREIGLAAGATEAVGYEIIHRVVKTGAKIAIWLSQRF